MPTFGGDFEVPAWVFSGNRLLLFRVDVEKSNSEKYLTDFTGNIYAILPEWMRG